MPGALSIFLSYGTNSTLTWSTSILPTVSPSKLILFQIMPNGSITAMGRQQIAHQLLINILN